MRAKPHKRAASTRRQVVRRDASGPVADVRALSDLVDRLGLAGRAGITFGGKRDLYDALGYRKNLSIADFRSRYERGDIAGRIVDAYPVATWRGGAELIEDQDPELQTEFERAWDALNDRLHAWSVLSSADRLAGVGRYAVVLIGAPGQLDEELPPKFSADSIAFLQAYAEDDAVVLSVEGDTSSPRYGMPTWYGLQPRESTASRRSRSQRRTHWSRVLHVVESLDNRVYGLPRLQQVWNRLDDLDKVVGGGSEAFFQRANPGLFFNIDKDAKFKDGELTTAREQADELAHKVRRVMALRGTKVTTLSADVASFNDAVDAILNLIAGATGIPKRILIGSERGELASTQDETAWDKRVAERRTSFAEPFVVRPFVDTLVTHGVLPPPTSFEVRWPDVVEMTPDRRAEIAVKWSSVNKNMGTVVVTPNEIRDHVLGLEELDEVTGAGDDADDLDEGAEDVVVVEGAESEGAESRAAARGKGQPG